MSKTVRVLIALEFSAPDEMSDAEVTNQVVESFQNMAAARCSFHAGGEDPAAITLSGVTNVADAE